MNEPGEPPSGSITTAAGSVPGMGLLRRLLERLNREDEDRGEPDPDEFVLVDVRQLTDGPLMTAAIEGAGIDARRIDSFDPVTGMTRCQIFVPRHAADEALAIVADFS